MKANRREAIRINDLDQPAVDARTADILLVGLSDDEVRTLPSRLFGALSGGTSVVTLHDLTPERLRQAMVVLSPIVGLGFDAIDLAERMAEGGFRGRYIAFASEVAHESLIRNEVRAVAPDVTFDIVTMGHGPRLAVN